MTTHDGISVFSVQAKIMSNWLKNDGLIYEIRNAHTNFRYEFPIRDRLDLYFTENFGNRHLPKIDGLIRGFLSSNPQIKPSISD